MQVSGTIRAFSYDGNGREILLYKLVPGPACILTTCCMLGDARYPAAAMAEEDIRGVALGLPLFKRLVAESEAFRTFVFNFFAQRVTEIMGLVEQLAFQRLDQRLAALLLTKHDRFEATHEQLADELGSVREVVSRLLKHFEHQGILRLGRGRIEIVDRTFLRKKSAHGDSSH